MKRANHHVGNVIRIRAGLHGADSPMFFVGSFEKVSHEYH